jgi:3-deoxy-D-manno-octulosonic-acid transferase
VAFGSHFHDDRSCQPLIKSSNRTQRQGHNNHNVIVPRRIERQSAQALLARSHNRPNVKKSSSEVHEPFEDVKLAGTSPRLLERPIHAGYDHSK